VRLRRLVLLVWRSPPLARRRRLSGDVFPRRSAALHSSVQTPPRRRVVGWRLRHRLLRVLLFAVLVLVPLAVGVSRLYRGMHHPSDVLFGVANGIVWAADNGAKVISMSLGGSGFSNTLNSAVQYAWNKGVILVAAAGNESRREIDARFEVSVSPPAVAEGIISVAALGTGAGGLAVADFSNTGANVSGPGVDIISAKRGGGLISMSGTSMATPHVAGVAALWAEKILKMGPLSSSQLAARLVGNALFEGMKAGFDPGDVGAGVATALLA